MRWLVEIETENDPIPACRLMNIFRRKGVRVETLTLAAQPGSYTLMALVETADSDSEHIFNFVRRTGGVRHVTAYRQESLEEASFILVDAEASGATAAAILTALPESKLIFAGGGKYLLEIAPDGRSRLPARGPGDPEFLPFARVKTTREVSRPQAVATPA